MVVACNATMVEERAVAASVKSVVGCIVECGMGYLSNDDGVEIGVEDSDGEGEDTTQLIWLFICP